MVSGLVTANITRMPLTCCRSNTLHERKHNSNIDAHTEADMQCLSYCRCRNISIPVNRLWPHPLSAVSQQTNTTLLQSQKATHRRTSC